MKFKQLGYTEKTIKVREMTMGAIVHTLAQETIRTDSRDLEIRIVDTYNGEVDVYENIEALIMTDFIDDYCVHFYSAAVMHDNKENKSYYIVVISDDIDVQN